MSTQPTTEPIPLELPTETWIAMVDMYMKRAFRPESVEVYWDCINKGATHELAVYDAVRNEATIMVLEQMVAEGGELPEEPHPTDNQ